MKKNLTFDEAMVLLDEGKLVKLPEWVGHWFKKDGEIKVFTREGNVLDTPYLSDYTNRTDWEQTDGLRDFGGALIAVKAGKLIARSGWNGKGMFVFQRPADELEVGFIIDKVKSLPQAVKDFFKANDEKEQPSEQGLTKVKFTAYLCMKAADGSIVNGWLASQTDMLAEDWCIIE